MPESTRLRVLSALSAQSTLFLIVFCGFQVRVTQALQTFLLFPPSAGSFSHFSGIFFFVVTARRETSAPTE